MVDLVTGAVVRSGMDDLGIGVGFLGNLQQRLHEGIQGAFILRLGWLELRRWNDELVDLLEAAQEYTDSKPLNITPDDHGDQT